MLELVLQFFRYIKEPHAEITNCLEYLKNDKMKCVVYLNYLDFTIFKRPTKKLRISFSIKSKNMIHEHLKLPNSLQLIKL